MNAIVTAAAIGQEIHLHCEGVGAEDVAAILAHAKARTASATESGGLGAD
jgi:hypothetical protein